MNFSFGIITGGNSDKYIQTIVDSIRNQNIPIYEILIIGKSEISGSDITNINFDETIKPGWLTKKKNIICKEAKYENIVLMHDYVCLDTNWYNGFLKYGNDFEICVNRIETLDRKRFRDFLIYPNGIYPYFWEGALLPYDYEPSKYISKLMYISGTYYVIKKDLALKFPLNEDLTMQTAGDDVELSHRLSNSDIIFKCNQYSTVYFLKEKDGVGWENLISHEDMNLLASFDNEHMSSMLFNKQKYIQRDGIRQYHNIYYDI